MIDSTRSPRPLWLRISTAVLVLAMIVALSWAIWVKELHHPSPHIRAFSSTGSTGLVLVGR